MRSRKVRDEAGKVHKLAVVEGSRNRCGRHKNAYTRRKLAVAAAKIEAKASGEPIEAYHCTECHCWHIGHPPGWRYQQHRAEHGVA